MGQVRRRRQGRRARDRRPWGDLRSSRSGGRFANFRFQVDPQHQTAAVGSGKRHRGRVAQQTVIVVGGAGDVDLFAGLAAKVELLGRHRQGLHRQHGGAVLEMTEFGIQKIGTGLVVSSFVRAFELCEGLRAAHVECTHHNVFFNQNGSAGDGLHTILFHGFNKTRTLGHGFVGISEFHDNATFAEKHHDCPSE